MKISIFTGTVDDGKRLATIKMAATVAKEHQADLLILPGHSFGRRNVSKSIAQTLVEVTGVPILAEVGSTYCFVPDKLPFGPFVQLFCKGANARRGQTQALINAFINGERLSS